MESEDSASLSKKFKILNLTVLKVFAKVSREKRENRIMKILVKKADDMEKKASGKEIKERSKIRILIDFLKDIRFTYYMARDYRNGDYRDVSWVTIVSIPASLFLMIFSPIGFIPVIGQIDDVIIILICLKLIHGDLEKYKRFKAEQEEQKS